MSGKLEQINAGSSPLILVSRSLRRYRCSNFLAFPVDPCNQVNSLFCNSIVDVMWRIHYVGSYAERKGRMIKFNLLMHRGLCNKEAPDKHTCWKG